MVWCVSRQNQWFSNLLSGMSTTGWHFVCWGIAEKCNVRFQKLSQGGLAAGRLANGGVSVTAGSQHPPKSKFGSAPD